ncbi:50S ribosomal protein L29 [Patescibacteria group bacterium]|nr:50S ribosomal protein L29 [Patescibacteria group bacterium]
MKNNEIEQLKSRVDSELLSDIKKNKDKLWGLQVDLRAGKLKNVNEVKKTKKMIARINTILSERKNN